MITDYFDLQELVCPDVFHKYGSQAWTFFDERLLITLETLRERINRPIFINDWQINGKLTQRGLRCNQCDLVRDKTNAGQLYLSAHVLGKAVDFSVQGMLSEETRQWILQHQNWWPYPLRLEQDVDWCHLDVCNGNTEKVHLFKA